MSKVCALCGKKPVAGNNVSHSKRHTRRRFNPNLVSKRFAGVKIQICTSCLRTLQKPERVRKVAEPKIETAKVAEPEIAEKKVAKKASAKK